LKVNLIASDPRANANGTPKSHEVTPHNSPEPEPSEASGNPKAATTPPKEPNTADELRQL